MMTCMRHVTDQTDLEARRSLELTIYYRHNLRSTLASTYSTVSTNSWYQRWYQLDVLVLRQ